MVVEFLLNGIKLLLISFINILPSFPTFELKIAEMVSWLLDLIATVSYLLPLDTLIPIFFAVIAIQTFHFWWKLIQRIWDALPLT